MNIDGSDIKLVSNGEGRTTCAFYNASADEIIYASTFSGDVDCPPIPPTDMGYVWPIYSSYEIYRAKPDGSNLTVIASSPAYDAEAVYSPDGNKIVFNINEESHLKSYQVIAAGQSILPELLQVLDLI